MLLTLAAAEAVTLLCDETVFEDIVALLVLSLLLIGIIQEALTVAQWAETGGATEDKAAEILVQGNGAGVVAAELENWELPLESIVVISHDEDPEAEQDDEDDGLIFMWRSKVSGDWLSAPTVTFFPLPPAPTTTLLSLGIW